MARRSVYAAPDLTDNLDPRPTVTCVPGSASTFPLGSRTVTCTAIDASGNLHGHIPGHGVGHDRSERTGKPVTVERNPDESSTFRGQRRQTPLDYRIPTLADAVPAGSTTGSDGSPLAEDFSARDRSHPHRRSTRCCRKPEPTGERLRQHDLLPCAHTDAYHTGGISYTEEPCRCEFGGESSNSCADSWAQRHPGR